MNKLLVENFLSEFAYDLKPSPFVQTAEEIRSGCQNLAETRRAMEGILEALAMKAPITP